MRTTVRLNDSILDAAKREAQRRGVTLTALIECSLVHEMSAGRKERKRVELPVSKMKGGPAPGLDLSSNAAIQAFLDEGLPLEKLR
jgi:hypothetical protein